MDDFQNNNSNDFRENEANHFASQPANEFSESDTGNEPVNNANPASSAPVNPYEQAQLHEARHTPSHEAPQTPSHHTPQAVPQAPQENAQEAPGFLESSAPKHAKPQNKKKKGLHLSASKKQVAKIGEKLDTTGEAAKFAGASRQAKKRRRKNILATILAVIGVALLLTGGGLWWYAQSQYNAQAEVNEKLAGYAKVSDDGSTPPQVDWAALKAVNSDVCAWIQIPGTTVNYPVYKGETNDTYLRTSAFGDYVLGGQIFLDASNKSADLTEEQTIVYGHHLNDGSMFAPVAKMDDQAYFNSIQRIWWVTPIAHEDGTYGQENFLCSPLFCYHVQEDDRTVRKFQWATTADFHQYLSEKYSLALAKAADAETTIPNVEHVLTLSTCEYSDGRGRCIVICNPVETTTQDTVQYS